MKKKRIYFFVLSTTPWVPYTYGALRVYCEKDPEVSANYEWCEPYFISSDPSSFLSSMIDPSVVCFSMYMWNEQLQNEIARQVQLQFPRALVIFGGPSVPNDPGCLDKNYHADLLVHGEGEVALTEILKENLNEKRDFSSIENVTLLKPDHGTPMFKGFQRRGIEVLESPYLKGYFDGALKERHFDGIEIVALWERERGCPYSCSFCDWPWTGSRLRSRPVEEMLKEIEFFADHKVRDIYMCDANFGLSPSDLTIAKALAESKRKTGYPKTLIYSSAKKSDARVSEIAQILSDADMVWGTTLSVQSLNGPTLQSIKRVNIPPSRFQNFSTDYSANRVGVYSEVILGLPLETKETFVQGIGKILEAGNHEDLRLFEFFVLPNAPAAQADYREKYGLVTRFKPLFIPSKKHPAQERVEIVVATKDMPSEDWTYSYLFGELIQALHNGAYARFVSTYLFRVHQVGFADFYKNLIDHFLNCPETALGSVFKRGYEMLEDFGQNDDIPIVHKVLWHDDLREFLAKYAPNRKGWFPYQLLWLLLSDRFEEVCSELKAYVRESYPIETDVFEDLFHFQKEIILRPEYNPDLGKFHQVQFNWFEFFYEHSDLTEQKTTYHFTDVATGPGHRFTMAPNMSLQQFSRAAVGDAYPFSKLRQFCHQPECIKIISQKTAPNFQWSREISEPNRPHTSRSLETLPGMK